MGAVTCLDPEAPSCNGRPIPLASILNLTILQPDNPLRSRGQFIVVRHHDNGQPTGMKRGEKIKYPVTVFRVEVAGGLVCKKHLGIVDHGPGHRHPLHLSAAELIGMMAAPGIETDKIKELPDLCFVGFPPCEKQGQGDIFINRKAGNEMKLLEDKSDFFPAYPNQLFFRELVHGRPVDFHDPHGRLVKTSHDVQHGCFSGTGRAHNGNKFSFADFQVHPSKGVHLFGTADIILLYTVKFYHPLMASMGLILDAFQAGYPPASKPTVNEKAMQAKASSGSKWIILPDGT